MQQTERHDSIALINGVIFPMAHPGRAQALLARAGKIAAIGSNEDVLARCDTKTTVLDMKGSFILPGFTDSHNHFLATGRSIETLDLSQAASIDELIGASTKYMSEGRVPEGEWFFAHGWDQNKMKENRFPNRHDLDIISKDVPLFFERSCGHIAALNSRALEILKITKDKKIAGGIIYLDEQGEPNGVISEAAVNWARFNIPCRSDATLRRWFKTAADRAVRFGITHIQSDDLETVGSVEKVFNFYEALEEDGKLPLRITQQWLLNSERELKDFIASGFNKLNGIYFRSGPLKIHVDGTLGARTAALREEYSDDPGQRGVYAHSQGVLNKLVKTAQEAGMQVAFYAIGDGAIERSLNAVQFAKDCEGNEICHRIVHCQIGAEDLFARMAELGVMADIQPAFVTSDWRIIMSRVGTERARFSYAWKTLMNRGIPIGAGSDAPAESLNPFIGMRAAVLRRDAAGQPPHGWMPVECFDRIAALNLYTAGSAAVCGEGTVSGTLEVGKYADFAAFSENPLCVNDEELPKLRAKMTVVDGRIRYIE